VTTERRLLIRHRGEFTRSLLIFGFKSEYTTGEGYATFLSLGTSGVLLSNLWHRFDGRRRRRAIGFSFRFLLVSDGFVTNSNRSGRLYYVVG